MSDDFPTRNIALLIDADNASWHAIDPVLTVLAELGSVNVRRVYGNWTKPGLKGWQDMTVKHGIEPQQQFDLTKGKNATDMKMTIDAMDLLFRGRVQGFGIMSSDSDFMPLATRIRQDGLPVYGFGNGNTPEGFRTACTRFIDVNALLETSKPKRVKKVDVPIDQSVPPSIGAAPPAAAKSLAGTVDDPELLQLLFDAYESLKPDAKGFVGLSALGQRAANRSSFDVRNYGYKRLSDLVDAIPSIDIDRRDNQVFVRWKD
ncbi:NYN domain-containing protein [Sphingomonas sp. NBWT7]|uniref:NYN domain-containing protein n=1 Tax=unclassified Sphingomonas TaxID=196159 RepID=UPI000A26EAF9|nr:MULTISPECIES: NYN domain-containing protein [unclassified Sphingomonas]QNE30964.1 NYN domain-containing protein [Sphingomonas sp. NBWT7]